MTKGAVVDVEVTSAPVEAEGAVPEITVHTGDEVQFTSVKSSKVV